MPDREKVIKWMENCVKGYEKACPEDCPYFQQCFPDGKAIPFMPLMQDALSILKEQESEEKRILKIVWDILHSGISTDMEADQDWVYEQIRNQVHQVY